MSSRAVTFNEQENQSHALRILMMALALFGLALGLSSCSPDDPFVPTRPTDTIPYKGAFLRVIHAAPDAPAVDVIIDGEQFFLSPQGYLDFRESNNNARYYPVSDTAKSISFTSGSSTISQTTLLLDRDGFHTAYLYGSQKRGYRVLVTKDSIQPPPGPGTVTKYRIVHLSPDGPDIDVKQDSVNTPRLITGLTYGSASNYVETKSHVPGTGMWIYYSGLDSVLRAFTPPYITLPPNVTFTLVLTGNAQPRGEESFLFFSAFQENLKQSSSQLYGAPPFNITFAAMRFVNIVGSGDSLLDVTFFDTDPKYVDNNNFRRNLIDQPQTMEGVASLGLPGQSENRRYFYISLIAKQDYPFRVEYHQPYNPPTVSNGDLRRQDVLVGRKELKLAPNRRYSIVAYGPYESGEARSALLLDNTPPPPVGMAQVRFFHGAYGAPHISSRYRIRIGGATGNLMSYGEVPTASNSFSVPASASTIDLLDESNNVVATMNLRKLEPDMSYTVFLSRGPFGNTLFLHALPEDVTLMN